jgi:hypothetical protein
MPAAAERRAVEAVIWGTPAVNFDVMYQAMVRDAKAGEDGNKIVYWSRLFDWKNQTLTRTRTRSTSCPFLIRRTWVPSFSKFHLPSLEPNLQQSRLAQRSVGRSVVLHACRRCNTLTS